MIMLKKMHKKYLLANHLCQQRKRSKNLTVIIIVQHLFFSDYFAIGGLPTNIFYAFFLTLSSVMAATAAFSEFVFAHPCNTSLPICRNSSIVRNSAASAVTTSP